MAKSTCESTHRLTEEPCTAAASFLVGIGTRKTDRQWACRRHLARVVTAFSGAEGGEEKHPVTVIWVP